MPFRRTARFRTCAAAIATLYFAPTLIPALSGLSHAVFHLVDEPVAAHVAEHAHPHEHADGRSAHVHSQLVDALLAGAPLTEDVLEEEHGPAPDIAGPGVHVPPAVDWLNPFPTGRAGPPTVMNHRHDRPAIQPPTPPPQA